MVFCSGAVSHVDTARLDMGQVGQALQGPLIHIPDPHVITAAVTEQAGDGTTDLPGTEQEDLAHGRPPHHEHNMRQPIGLG